MMHKQNIFMRALYISSLLLTMPDNTFTKAAEKKSSCFERLCRNKKKIAVAGCGIVVLVFSAVMGTKFLRNEKPQPPKPKPKSKPKSYTCHNKQEAKISLARQEPSTAIRTSRATCKNAALIRLQASYAPQRPDLTESELAQVRALEEQEEAERLEKVSSLVTKYSRDQIALVRSAGNDGQKYPSSCFLCAALHLNGISSSEINASVKSLLPRYNQFTFGEQSAKARELHGGIERLHQTLGLTNDHAINQMLKDFDSRHCTKAGNSPEFLKQCTTYVENIEPAQRINFWSLHAKLKELRSLEDDANQVDKTRDAEPEEVRAFFNSLGNEYKDLPCTTYENIVAFQRDPVFLKETSLEEHDIIQALKTSTNPAFEINIAGHYVALTLNKTDKTVVLADSAREPQDYSEQTKRIKTIFFE